LLIICDIFLTSIGSNLYGIQLLQLTLQAIFFPIEYIAELI